MQTSCTERAKGSRQMHCGYEQVQCSSCVSSGKPGTTAPIQLVFGWANRSACWGHLFYSLSWSLMRSKKVSRRAKMQRSKTLLCTRRWQSIAASRNERSAVLSQKFNRPLFAFVRSSDFPSSLANPFLLKTYAWCYLKIEPTAFHSSISNVASLAHRIASPARVSV